MKTLEEIVEAGKFPADSSLGRTFNRDSRGGASEDYKLCKTTKEKEAFRVWWASERLKDMKTREVFSETTSEDTVNVSCGEYLPFKVIWDREGGDEEGFEARSLRTRFSLRGPA